MRSSYLRVVVSGCATAAPLLRHSILKDPDGFWTRDLKSTGVTTPPLLCSRIRALRVLRIVSRLLLLRLCCSRSRLLCSRLRLRCRSRPHPRNLLLLAALQLSRGAEVAELTGYPVEATPWILVKEGTWVTAAVVNAVVRERPNIRDRQRGLQVQPIRDSLSLELLNLLWKLRGSLGARAVLPLIRISPIALAAAMVLPLLRQQTLPLVLRSTLARLSRRRRRYHPRREKKPRRPSGETPCC